MRNFYLFVLIQRINAQLEIIREDEVSLRSKRSTNKIKTGQDEQLSS